ncbi:MAG: Ni/Fe hydrogenase subunit alpha [Candidatus Methanofastidiosa archaeon]|nr:Ni/Fe hydrogenase subunit alpha [Candidatus Methanofastidiosa archaeon]
MTQIDINPITRLEGHGNIKIFTDDAGNVQTAYLQIPELRAFEKFCVGRQAEYMPQLTSRICGVCPVPHHLASNKALDMAYSAPPPARAVALRRLMHYGYIIEDHLLHFYFLGGPDLLLGPDMPPGKRNIVGIIEVFGKDVAQSIMKHRKIGQSIVKLLGGKAIHPAFGIPGGVSNSVTEENLETLVEDARSSIAFAQFSLELFRERILGGDFYPEALTSDEYSLTCYNMGVVDEKNRTDFYDGRVRITDAEGKEVACFEPSEYLSHVGEAVEKFSYMKFPFYRALGWKGLVESPDNGVYRVGPLGRFNASAGYTTPLAEKEGKKLASEFGRPCNMTLAYHWARLIEVLNASELLFDLVSDRELLLTGDTRTPVGKITGRGVGCVEAARGTLIHDYGMDANGVMSSVNLIVPTTHNAAAISLSIMKAAQAEFDASRTGSEDKCNRVEVALRAYDPCFGCATH